MVDISPIQHQQDLLKAQQLSQEQLESGMKVDNAQIDMNEKFSTYNQFADKYPKLDQAIKQSLVQSIMGDLRRHERHMKEILRESRRHGCA